jgi:hypothetical protein
MMTAIRGALEGVAIRRPANGRSSHSSLRPSAQTATYTIHLDRGEIIRLNKDSGIRQVQVRSGAIWLTGTPDRADILLHRADRFQLSNNWPFVLQALEEARIVLLS